MRIESAPTGLPARALARAGDLGGGVPVGYVAPEFLHVFGGQKAGLELPVEAQVLLEAAHLDGILEHLAVATEADLSVTPRDRYDTYVQVRRPGPVQAYLFLTAMLSFLERAEVEKIEDDGFLDLVNVIAGEKHPGNVCLDEVDGIDRVVERFGSTQAVDQTRIKVARRVRWHFPWPID